MEEIETGAKVKVIWPDGLEVEGRLERFLPVSNSVLVRIPMTYVTVPLDGRLKVEVFGE